MTTGEIIAIGFVVLLVAAALWGVRGHPRGGDGSGNQYGMGGDEASSGGGD
jgi:hypothetical protein